VGADEHQAGPARAVAGGHGAQAPQAAIGVHAGAPARACRRLASGHGSRGRPPPARPSAPGRGLQHAGGVQPSGQALSTSALSGDERPHAPRAAAPTSRACSGRMRRRSKRVCSSSAQNPSGRVGQDEQAEAPAAAQHGAGGARGQLLVAPEGRGR
jgi:hypothetical protein